MHAKRSRVALAVGLVGLAVPASAIAATQIGQTGVPEASCAPASTNLVQAATGGPPAYAAPAGGGVITSWSYQGYPPNPGSGKMIVWRPTNVPDQFIVVGKTATESFSAALQTFATRIPVQGGDVLGTRGAVVCLDALTLTGDVVRYNNTAADPPDGSTQTFFPPLNGYRVLVAASVEPDCDGDGFGDETQDPSVLGGECPLRGRTLTLDANKNKVKKGKNVTLSGRLTELVRQGECQATQTVELQRKKPSQTEFTTVAQLTTDPAGAFSTKRKVKKTFEYRAQVPETATCAEEVSDTEKVKVKKKK